MRSYDFEHVIIADSSVFECLGIARVLRRATICQRTTTVTDFSKLEQAVEPATGMVLLEASLPGFLSSDQIARVRATNPHVHVAVMSATCDADTLIRLLDAGIHGLVPKQSEQDLVNASRAIAGGHIYLPSNLWDEVALSRSTNAAKVAAHQPLSNRQEQVLSLASEGCSNKEIAAFLHISESTVKVHMGAVLRILGVPTRGRAVAAFSATRKFEAPAFSMPGFSDQIVDDAGLRD